MLFLVDRNAIMIGRNKERERKSTSLLPTRTTQTRIFFSTGLSHSFLPEQFYFIWHDVMMDLQEMGKET